MTEKIYIGNGKEIETKFGKMTKLSFSKKDLLTMTANLNEKGWVTLDLNERKEPSEWGHTHYMKIDTWKPTKKDDGSEEATIQDVPF